MNIKEVARVAGVSVATVSRSLNQPHKVSDETRNRILEIISKLDYVPNPSAKSLSTGKTRTVACIMPTLRNEFFNQLVEGCQKVLSYANYRMLIYSMNNNEHYLECIDQRSVDGIIISGSDFTQHTRSNLNLITVPYVLIEHVDQFESLTHMPASVYIEDYNGVQLALKYLYAEGNRCFGILGGISEYIVTQRRLRAVYDFFERHPDCTYYVSNSDYSDLEQAHLMGQAFLKKTPRPTAIFAFNDMMAAGVLRSVLSSGIKVPEEIEVMGFDDIPLGRFFTPSLSTVSAPNTRLGEKAAELLLSKLSGKPAPQSVLYPVDLHLRESTKNTVPLTSIF